MRENDEKRHPFDRNMATSQIIKAPVMDWSIGEGLYKRFKLWKQQCELLFSGPLVKLEEPIQSKYLLYWSGERGLELFSSWDLSEDEQKILRNYFDRFENFVKPHSNELIAAWELYNIKQATLSLEEFIAKLRLLMKDANYPIAHHERFLRDFLVFEMNSQRVSKECLKEGNSLTFQKAKDVAKAEESADTQLKLMNKTTEVNTVKKHLTRKAGKSDDKHSSAGTFQKPSFSCGRGPHARDRCPAKSGKCHFCKKTEHFANVCLSKKKKQNVHEVEVKHPVNISEFSIPESAVFMGPVEAIPLNLNTVTCKEKALLSVKIAPSSRGCQKTVTCKIDSGAETNIVPRSLYNQICPETTVLEKPTVKLSAYGGTEVPNLGSCKMYVQGPHNCEPKQITF